ncbi:protease complex subunit PrcB family protein [Natronocella acetinitrilica]|nr:protease complex subunit PrcB family protein [Natronocella acetinitrilica]
MQRLWRLFAGPVLVTLAGGCTLGGDMTNSKVPVEVLQSSAHCETTEAGYALRLAVDQAGFNDLARVARTGGSTTVLTEGQDVGVLVAMGERPTGGYALELAADEAVVEGAVATLVVTVMEPGPHDMVTMALTTPCLLLRVLGDNFDTVRAVDAAGNELARRSVPRHGGN